LDRFLELCAQSVVPPVSTDASETLLVLFLWRFT